jgi:multiple sugar transport system substrate-binding protein
MKVVMLIFSAIRFQKSKILFWGNDSMVKSKFSKAISVVIAILLITALFGCSSANNTANENNAPAEKAPAPAETEAPAEQPEVTIKFANFSASGDNEKFLAQMKDEFEKQNPKIKVEIETIGYGDYFTQMQTRVASGTAPDAYELNYENFVSYAKKGVLKDLKEFFTTSNFDKSTVNTQALNAFQSDGVQYGMPASFSNVVLIYNKDLFDKANVKYPTKDWTWKEMNEAAAKIRALSKDTFGVHQGVHFWEFYKAVQQNGGSLLNADMTQFTVNSPQNVETLQHMADRILVSNVMATDAQLSGMGDWDLFKGGKLGMIVTGIWAFPDFIKNITFNWDIAVEPGNVKKATHFFSNGLVINKDSKAAAAAFEWVKFMSASKEAAKIRVDAGWELPAVTYPDVLEAYLAMKPPANRQAVFDSLEFLVTPPVIEQFAEMADIMGLHLKAAAEGAKTPAQALEDAQKELEQKIKLK